MFFRLFLIFKLLMAKLIVISVLGFSFVACPSAALAANPKILIYGDSLSAAYGIQQQQGWASLLQKKLNSQHYHYDVINASVSGETTSGGLKPNFVYTGRNTSFHHRYRTWC